jgi:hypothetical protein
MISRKPKKKTSNLHYRSARAIPPINSSNHYHHAKDKKACLSYRCKWILIKGVILISGLSLFLGSLYLPFIADNYNDTTQRQNVYSRMRGHEHSPFKAVTAQWDEIKSVVEKVENKVKKAVQRQSGNKSVVGNSIVHGIGTSTDIDNSSSSSSSSNLARGLSGLPMSETPALVGATRGHVNCDVDVDRLAYWNNQGERDNEFKSPFIGQKGVSNVPVHIDTHHMFCFYDFICWDT